MAQIVLGRSPEKARSVASNRLRSIALLASVSFFSVLSVGFPYYDIMRYQPNRDYVSNDDVQTPLELAEQLVKHFKPSGRILEPCRGDGNIYRFLEHAEWCEIKEGRDFLHWDKKVDWILTNPPWSEIRPFMAQAMKVADNIVFLLTINHIWTKARVRDILNSGFGIKEIALVDMPKSFPQSGFQLGAVYIARGWAGDIKLSNLSTKIGPEIATECPDEATLPPSVFVVERVARNSLKVAVV